MSARTLARAGRLRLPPHRASSATLAGAYPFLSAPLPDHGVPIGDDAFTGAAFAFDPWSAYADGLLTNPNAVLTGVIGQGKSALAKSLAVRSIAAGRRVYVPGDPKGEWAPVARAVCGQVVALGPGMPGRLNPLDVPDGQLPATARASQLRLLASLAETTLGRDLVPIEHTALDAALLHAVPVAGDHAPTLPSIVAALVDPGTGPSADVGLPAAELRHGGRDLAHGLRRIVRGDLAGMFDGPSTVRLDATAPMTVLDLSRIGSHDDALAIAMACSSAWLEAAVTSGTGKRWIIYDEGWRLLNSLPLLRRMQSQWKLSRAHGIANLLVLHRLSDLDAAGATGSEIRAVADGLLADCSTRIIYRQESDQLSQAATALGLTGPERSLLPMLPRGTGLWKLPRASYVVRHRLHSDEAQVFDTDAAMHDTPAGGSR